jgi:hypothetical protein
LWKGKYGSCIIYEKRRNPLVCVCVIAFLNRMLKST